MPYTLRSTLSVAILALLGALSLVPARTSAQGGQRCFPETGRCISGAIRAYWEQGGGLPVFGYPITDVRTETVEGRWTGPVQWFERDRLEDHQNEGLGVMAGRLGARWLELQGKPWQTLPGAPGPGDPNQCRYVSETKHTLCGRFRSYWERNGGLQRFGLPLSEVFNETVEGRAYAVQYFERRRMEYHPEQAGTPYEVLLGLLGRDVHAREGSGPVAQPTPGDLPAAVQQPILDATYAAIRQRDPRVKLAAGLTGVVGEYAAALVLPFGQRTIYVYLARRAGTWQVVEATTIPSSAILRQRGIPEELWSGGDAGTVIDLALARLQDRRGRGFNAYVTRPRVAGNFARLWSVPGPAENLDPVSAFYKRERGEWRFLTAGSAFPEADLRALGIPRELWPYGASVRGPSR